MMKTTTKPPIAGSLHAAPDVPAMFDLTRVGSLAGSLPAGPWRTDRLAKLASEQVGLKGALRCHIKDRK